MYAIVEIAGQQFKVEKNQKILVHRLEGKEGSKVDFDRVLLIDNDKNVLIGEPHIQGAVISAKILSHAKGDKIRVFKKKRRKGYKVLNGHRQYLTEVQIEDIKEKAGAKKPAAAKTTAEKTAAEKTATTKKPATKKEPVQEKKEAAGASVKKTASGKTAAGTTAAKKAAAKKTTSQAGTAKKATPKKPAADKDSKQ